jgi:hypothetical protein
MRMRMRMATLMVMITFIPMMLIMVVSPPFMSDCLLKLLRTQLAAGGDLTPARLSEAVSQPLSIAAEGARRVTWCRIQKTCMKSGLRGGAHLSLALAGGLWGINRSKSGQCSSECGPFSSGRVIDGRLLGLLSIWWRGLLLKRVAWLWLQVSRNFGGKDDLLRNTLATFHAQ